MLPERMRVNVTRPPFPRTGGGDPWGGIPTGITQNRTVLRMCGGAPQRQVSVRGQGTFSPRMRDDPIEEQKKAVRAGIPRTGGGNPYTKSVTIESPALSTHGQGYRRALQTAGTKAASRGGEPRAAVFCVRKKGRGKHSALRTAGAESAAFTIRKQFSRKSQTKEWQNRGNT